MELHRAVVIVAKWPIIRPHHYIHNYLKSHAGLNPDSLPFVKANVIVAPVIEARGFRVRVPSHALRDPDPPAVLQVIGYAGGPERMAAYRRLNAGIGSAAPDQWTEPSQPRN
jgi:hypothetical protein